MRCTRARARGYSMLAARWASLGGEVTLCRGGWGCTLCQFLVPCGWGVPCASSTGPEPLHVPRSLCPPWCQAMRLTKAQKPEGNAQTCSPSFPGTARSSRGAIEAREQSGRPSSRTARKKPRSSQGTAMEQPGRPRSSQGAARSSQEQPGSSQGAAKEQPWSSQGGPGAAREQPGAAGEHPEPAASSQWQS